MPIQEQIDVEDPLVAFYAAPMILEGRGGVLVCQECSRSSTAGVPCSTHLVFFPKYAAPGLMDLWLGRLCCMQAARSSVRAFLDVLVGSFTSLTGSSLLFLSAIRRKDLSEFEHKKKTSNEHDKQTHDRLTKA